MLKMALYVKAGKLGLVLHKIVLMVLCWSYIFQLQLQQITT